MRLALNKEGWSRFRFDEIAQKISKTVSPAETDLERYIGLEHIDAEDIHIRRWGSPSDVKGGKLLCYPGDIIFGKRRAYQRKAAIVEEESICSAHAFVFRAIEGVILPEFLPFFLHSDSFMNRMVDISVGGLSPTINWGDLKHQEFLLPPKDQQAELAELLWSLNKYTNSLILADENLYRLDLSLLTNHFGNNHDTNKSKLKNLVSIKKGKKPSQLVENGDGIPYCTAKYLRGGHPEFLVPNNSVTKEIKIQQNDIVILWDGSNAGEILRGKKGILASTMCKLEILSDDYSDYIYQFLRFKAQDIRRATVGSAIPHVDPGMIENIEIPELTAPNQLKLLTHFNEISENIRSVKELVRHSKTLQKSIINQIF